MHRHNHDHR